MATFYNHNDLMIRRVQANEWLCSQNKKLQNMIHYGELVSADYKNKLAYVVAALESVGCYEPITTAAEDGVKNCLTEAQVTQIFDNISEITGLSWRGKGTTYRNQANPLEGIERITASVVLSNGEFIHKSNPAVIKRNDAKTRGDLLKDLADDIKKLEDFRPSSAF